VYRKKPLAALLSILATFAFVAAACGSDEAADPGTTTGGGSDPTGETISVGLAYDLGGRGDKSFNDSAAEGLDRAKGDYNIDATELEPASADDRGPNLQKLAEDGRNPVIGVGFAFGDLVTEIAAAFPDTTFVTIDAPVEADNVIANVFAEEQGSFLVGAAAGLKTTSNKVGFIGGVDMELIQKFQAGFEAGVKATNPDATVEVKYLSPEGDFSGFSSPQAAQESAAAMYQGGVDVIFHAAGGSGSGLFDAAVAAGDGKWAIGVDSDQYLTATPDQQAHILTSMVKRVDVAVYNSIKAFNDGDTKGRVNVLDLSVDGVGYSTEGGYLDDIKDQLEDLKQQIIDGKITVPSSPGS
jgi:basic membrane protein A